MKKSHEKFMYSFADDTLTQLAEIHENIQRMRMENAAETARMGLERRER